MTDRELDDLTARANRAYWESDEGVNQISEDLDLSKSALYGLLLPLETGDPCPVCGGPLTWENRTARDRGQTTCPACEAAEGEDEPETVKAEERAGQRSGSRGPRRTPEAEALSIAPGLEIRADDARTLGGAVLVGLGAGFLAAVLLLGRR